MKPVYNGEKDKRLYKNVLGEMIGNMILSDERIVYLDADLMSCICTGKLPEQTDRAIDCGIAEANMIGVACGLSSVGFKPIVHTFGPFASRRVFDQIFLSGGYAGNSVTVIGTDPGVTAELNGGTHMPFEDIALYREIPQSVIVDVTDITMLQAFLQQLPQQAGVKYLRVGRKASWQIYPDGYSFEVGRGAVLREGNDAVIIASGIMVREALEAAQTLAAENIEVSVIDPVTIKPLDADLIKEYAARTGAVITAENHNKIGGLTSAVEHALCGMKLRFGYVAVEDVFGEVGPQAYLQKRFGLTAEHIAAEVMRVLSNSDSAKTES